MSDENLQVFLNSTSRLKVISFLYSIFGIEPVNVVTCDGRVIVGILQTFDQTMNLVLSHTHERYFSGDKPVAIVQLGNYLIRGDNV